MDRIQVSPEMVTIVGDGPVADTGLIDPILFAFRFAAPATVAIGRDVAARADADLRCFVEAAACRRIFGDLPGAGTYHLPATLGALALAIRDCALPGEAGITLRLAKSIELLCAVFTAFADDELIAVTGAGVLSESETRRIVQARRIVDERWHEKLTLDGIARGCGTNRAKLTRDFRTMFGTSVADALAERRLGGAREMLLSTDLPVSSVGYACGYLNNASFTRAFSRRFGVVPTRLRAMAMAA